MNDMHNGFTLQRHSEQSGGVDAALLRTGRFDQVSWTAAWNAKTAHATGLGAA